MWSHPQKFRSLGFIYSSIIWGRVRLTTGDLLLKNATIFVKHLFPCGTTRSKCNNVVRSDYLHNLVASKAPCTMAASSGEQRRASLDKYQHAHASVINDPEVWFDEEKKRYPTPLAGHVSNPLVLCCLLPLASQSMQERSRRRNALQCVFMRARAPIHVVSSGVACETHKQDGCCVKGAGGGVKSGGVNCDGRALPLPCATGRSRGHDLVVARHATMRVYRACIYSVLSAAWQGHGC